jgi:AraC family transcriptional regulator
MNKYSKEYIFRVNRVIDFIENNLDEELTPEKISDVANFSRFHFHRIFAAFTGETLNEFIKRKRAEKAAFLLLNEPDKAIAEIAERCGYNSTAVFCRNFRERFGTNAGEYRNQNSKNGQKESNNSKLDPSGGEYVCDIVSPNKRRFKMKKNVEILDMPAMNVVYCRHTGNFEGIRFAYEKLFRWAGPRGLMSADSKCITYYHDDPKITDIDKVRQSACLVVKDDVKPEGEIGKMQIPGGKYFVSHFEISQAEFQEAWDSTCLWLSETGYQPEDKGPFEIYHNNHEEHPEKKFIVDICIPVKPL